MCTHFVQQASKWQLKSHTCCPITCRETEGLLIFWGQTTTGWQHERWCMLENHYHENHGHVVGRTACLRRIELPNSKHHSTGYYYDIIGTTGSLRWWITSWRNKTDYIVTKGIWPDFTVTLDLNTLVNIVKNTCYMFSADSLMCSFNYHMHFWKLW